MWPERVIETLERTLKDSEHLKRHLSQMLLAQGYQDLSGQIISSVITLVIELESVLGQLVALANGEDTRRMPVLRLDTTQPMPEALMATGPQVPGISRGIVVEDQADIDALLASVAAGK
jgi:chemotaxis protein CheZ